jgi:hypothetical protein
MYFPSNKYFYKKLKFNEKRGIITPKKNQTKMMRNVLVIGQRKSGVDLDPSTEEFSYYDTPKRCKEVNIELEEYVLQVFPDEDFNIEYLSHFPKEVGSADYNMLFGGRLSKKNKKFVREKAGNYDLIIVYSAPYVSFIMGEYIVQDLHTIMKPNALLSMYLLNQKNQKYWSIYDFKHFIRKFERFPSIYDELLFIKR